MSARSMAAMVAAGLVLGCAALHAEPKSKYSQSDVGAEREVIDLLRREAASPIDRRASLQPLLKRLPDSEAARWQSGFIKTEKSWRSFDAPLDTEQAALMAEFRDRRSAATDSVRGKLALAKWCDANALNDEARALRTAALFLASPAEQPHILKSLGYRQAGNQWVGPRELRDAKRTAHEAELSVKLWGPRIERIARQLQASTHQRIAARKALFEIADPAAIPAMEIHLGPQEPALLVEKLATMPAYEASLSLARLAVFTDAAEVRA
ncbi:MAG TPA: hypothetical protein VHB77_09810, partial [Planctomycetaceae bacterium]|nr:hypothetical protein [Planctomycetaceae bacterium]